MCGRSSPRHHRLQRRLRPVAVVCRARGRDEHPSAERLKTRSRRSPDRPARRSRSSTSPSTSSPWPKGWSNPWGLAFLPDGQMLVTETARPAPRRQRRRQAAVGAGRRPARGRRARAGRLLDVALDPAFAEEPADLLELRRAAETAANNTAVARGRFVDGAAPQGRERAGHLPPGAVARLDAALRRTPRLQPRRHALHHARRALDHRGPHAGAAAWTACSARSCASTPTARCRRTTRSSARRACGRRSGRSATATSRRRRCIPTTGELWEVEHGTRGGDELNVARKGKDYGWPTIAYGIEYQGGADHRRHPAAGGHGAAALLLGSRHRAERHGVLHRQAVPGVAEQPVHRRPRRARTWCG